MLTSVVSLRPCARPGCHRQVLPGHPSYPHCSGACASKAAEMALEQVRVWPVRAGQVVALPCRGGGVMRKPAPFEGILVSQGEGPAVLIPRASIQAALDLLDWRSREANGHGR